MTEQEAREALIALWLAKSDDSLACAELVLKEGHANAALNRVYYACFYAVTALFMKEGRQFARHSTLLSEVHRCLVSTGQLAKEWGGFYQRLFRDRQDGDYVASARFEARDVAARLGQAQEFVRIIRGMIQEG